RAVRDDFLCGYYGKAGPYIGKYIEALTGALGRSGSGLDIYEPPTNHADDFLSAADVGAFNAIFDKAEAAAAGDPAAVRRVRTARLPLIYAMLEIGKNDMFGPRGFYSEENNRFTPKPEMIGLIDAFAGRCREGGVRSLNESGLTPEDYTAGVRRFIDVQVEGNAAFRRPVQADPPPSSKYARGDLSVLTNGVRGAVDFKVHWLGWEGRDFALILDLGKAVQAREISLSTLSDQRSWILHPETVACSVSADGAAYREIGASPPGGDHRGEEPVRVYRWPGPIEGGESPAAVRFIRFSVEGTRRLPDWHPSAGGLSWVFVDEIIVR
ncbi:MAG: hypothetical protein JW843_00955, partial [Candidatus Aminicenantes bacterium]|nr:hypothetical protein [Candidatus Aminicenantes bacterium]